MWRTTQSDFPKDYNWPKTVFFGSLFFEAPLRDSITWEINAVYRKFISSYYL